MERAEQAARELREGLEKLRQVVTDHRDRLARTAVSGHAAANDDRAAAVVEGRADNDR